MDVEKEITILNQLSSTNARGKEKDWNEEKAHKESLHGDGRLE